MPEQVSQKRICQITQTECSISAAFTHKMPQVDSVLAGHKQHIRHYMDNYMRTFKEDVDQMLASSRALVRVLQDKGQYDQELAKTFTELFKLAHRSYSITIDQTNARTDLCPAEQLALASIQNSLNTKIGSLLIYMNILDDKYVKKGVQAPAEKADRLSVYIGALEASISAINSTTELPLDPDFPHPVLKFQPDAKKD